VTFQIDPQLKRVHILGIGGTLMAPFAVFLQKSGVQVSGTDQKLYPPMSELIARSGIKVFEGYSAENLDQLDGPPDLVIVGNVIRAVNPEVQEVSRLGWKKAALPHFMQEHLLQKTRNIVIAGTHGKTTTSSLMAHVFEKADRNPSYFIGGVSRDLPESFRVTSIDANAPFILEGDEYDTVYWDKVPKFKYYLPDHAILTSVEFDHADIYRDLSDVVSVFQGFVRSIRPGGRLIACSDYENVRKLLSETGEKILTYGFEPSAYGKSRDHFQISQFLASESGMKFEILKNGALAGKVSAPMSGKHNALNLLAVWICARENGIDETQIQNALSTFHGVSRRQEVRAEKNGVTVIDDFAHHPTAVRETLLGLKSRYPGRRLIAVFEPRSATSRRKVFQKEYGQAFVGADLVFIAIPHDQSEIRADDRFSSDELIRDLKSNGLQAQCFSTVEEGIQVVLRAKKPGDVIAVLSNGGFGGFIPKLVAGL